MATAVLRVGRRKTGLHSRSKLLRFGHRQGFLQTPLCQATHRKDHKTATTKGGIPSNLSNKGKYATVSTSCAFCVGALTPLEPAFIIRCANSIDLGTYDDHDINCLFLGGRSCLHYGLEVFGSGSSADNVCYNSPGKEDSKHSLSIMFIIRSSKTALDCVDFFAKNVLSLPKPLSSFTVAQLITAAAFTLKQPEKR